MTDPVERPSPPITSASAKDLAERLFARAESWRTLAGNYLYYGKPEATVDEAAAALLTRYAEVEGELETTGDDRAWLSAFTAEMGHTDDGETFRQAKLIFRILRDITRLTAQVAALKEERDAARVHIVDLQVLAYGWMVAHDCLKAGSQYTLPKPADVPALVSERDAANARAERLAGDVAELRGRVAKARDEIGAVVWCMPDMLGDLTGSLYAALALLTEPEAKGGDPDTHVDDDGRTADRTDPNGAEPTNIAQPARDPDPVPATQWTEKRLREEAKDRGWYVREGTSVPIVQGPEAGGWRHPFHVTVGSRELVELLNGTPVPATTEKTDD